MKTIADGQWFPMPLRIPLFGQWGNFRMFVHPSIHIFVHASIHPSDRLSVCTENDLNYLSRQNDYTCHIVGRSVGPSVCLWVHPSVLPWWTVCLKSFLYKFTMPRQFSSQTWTNFFRVKTNECNPETMVSGVQQNMNMVQLMEEIYQDLNNIINKTALQLRTQSESRLAL